MLARLCGFFSCFGTKFVSVRKTFSMIVASMNLDEIRHEIMLDYKMIVNKMDGLYPRLRREILRSGKKVMQRSLDYQTRQYNKWILRLTWDKKNIGCESIVLYFDSVGVCAAEVYGNRKINLINVYHTHFFQRYRQRTHKENLSQEELVKEFFEKRGQVKDTVIQRPGSGIYLTISVLSEGVAFGQLLPGIHLMKTFLPFHMLKPCQMSVVEQIRNGDATIHISNEMDEMMVRQLRLRGATILPDSEFPKDDVMNFQEPFA